MLTSILWKKKKLIIVVGCYCILQLTILKRRKITIVKLCESLQVSHVGHLLSREIKVAHCLVEIQSFFDRSDLSRRSPGQWYIQRPCAAQTTWSPSRSYRQDPKEYLQLHLGPTFRKTCRKVASVGSQPPPQHHPRFSVWILSIAFSLVGYDSKAAEV